MLRVYPKSVTLKNGRQVTVRPLNDEDFSQLLAFFEALPNEDRLFLRHDVRDPELIRQWTSEVDPARIIPLVADDDGRIVADGTLHLAERGWQRHVGTIRLVTARTHRHMGLGGLIARELVYLAEGHSLEKLQGEVIEDDLGAVRMFEKLGFRKEAVLSNMVKDQRGENRNLAIMVNEVADLSRIMEDWIQASMQPAYRAPGEG